MTLRTILGNNRILITRQISTPHTNCPIRPRSNILMTSPTIQARINLNPLIMPDLRPIRRTQQQQIQHRTLTRMYIRLRPRPHIHRHLNLTLNHRPPPTPNNPIKLCICHNIPSSVNTSMYQATTARYRH